MNNNYNRKDCDPKQTVNKIKNILKKNNIKVKESKIINIDNSIYSTRVELRDIPGMGTNGKGVSREFALASAYAEFMERLQSKFLLKSNFLNKEIKKSFSDEIYLEYEEFEKKFPYIKNNKHIREIVKNNAEYRYYTKFYDIYNNRYIDLPIKLINLLTHSNGLCSGNSKEEALVQGICEILERYCYREILFKEIPLPSIKIDNIEEYSTFKQLRELQRLGFVYSIKDCSLNKQYPVVGLLIYDKNKEKYIFTIGSDPDFNIALQRCITEAFQGLEVNEIEKKMKPVNNNYQKMKEKYNNTFKQDNWLKCYSSNSGIHPISFFDDKLEVNLKLLPFFKVEDNNEALEVILERLKEKKLKLYIKDYSYLGFDTYKVYIPSLSEIEELDDITFKVSRDMQTIRSIYFNICQIKDINGNYTFETLFEELAQNIKYNDFVLPNNIFNVNTYIQGDYLKLNYTYILIIELLLSKQYNKVIKIIEERLKNSKINNYEREYLDSIKKLILKKTEKDTINKKFKKDVEFLLNHTEKYLENLKAPTCPNCNICNCRSSCKYRKWRAIDELIYKSS